MTIGSKETSYGASCNIVEDKRRVVESELMANKSRGLLIDINEHCHFEIMNG